MIKTAFDRIHPLLQGGEEIINKLVTVAFSPKDPKGAKGTIKMLLVASVLSPKGAREKP